MSVIFTEHWAKKVALSVDFEMVLQVRLSEKDAVAVFVRAAKLLGMLVRVKMLGETVLTGEGLIAVLRERGREGGMGGWRREGEEEGG